MFGFSGKKFPINVLYNEEQLLDFALHYMTIQNDSDQVHEVAEQIIVTYILREWQKAGREEFTEEEVDERMGQLIAEHVLAGLVKKGFVEVDFNEDGEPVYRNVDLEGLV